MKSPPFAILAVLVLLLTWTHAAITVNGLTARSYYLNSVSFSIQKDAGFTYSAKMDGATISTSGTLTESRIGYHELSVTKTPTAGGAAETLKIQFIIKDGARAGDTDDNYPESGIGRWTPLRSIDAPPTVLDAGNLTLVAPPVVPPDFPLPLVARLLDGSGNPLRVMGTMEVQGAQTGGWLRLFRGVGSQVLRSRATGGAQNLTCNIGTRVFTKSVTVNAAPVWQTLSGAGGGRTFAAGSFVDVTGEVTVASGTTLTFGAGCVVRCAQDVSFEVLGTLTVNGTAEQPVLFAPQGTNVWGGIWVHGASSAMHARYLILTGGGADQSWMTGKGFHAHRGNEPLFTWSDSAKGYLEDCYFVDNPKSQALHGEESISAANPFQITRCLFQKTTTGGQIHNCSLVFDGNHIVETPRDEAAFSYSDATDDFDGLYCDGGTTVLKNSVIGWTKDDGIDIGTGSTSVATVTNCWFESCFHEGMAWSEGGTRTVTDTVAMNNGQGLECGFTNQGAGTPAVNARRVYLTGNLNGIRYGDNYDWIYGGKFDVHDSLSLFNNDDVFGRYWGNLVNDTVKDWAYIGKDRTAATYMHLEAVTANTWAATIVSTAQTEHPNIPTWDPNSSTHLARLAPFVTLPALPSGFGIAQDTRQFARSAYGGSIPVRLDRPVSATRNISWRVLGRTTLESSTDTILSSGTLTLVAGCQAKHLDLPPLTNAENFGVITLQLLENPDCLATGPNTAVWVDLNFPGPPPVPAPVTLLPRSVAGWKYFAKATPPHATWATTTYSDAAWNVGTTPLQTNETALGGTAVPGNSANLQSGGTPRPFNSVYMRKTFEVTDKSPFTSLTLGFMRDDGGVVYLNGVELKRDNMPATGTISYNTEALLSPTFEDTYREYTGLPVTSLVNGTNLLAVEIHQFPIPTDTLLTTSSDMRMNIEVFGQAPQALAPLSQSTAMLDGVMQLYWSDAAAVLQTTTDLSGHWTDLPTARSPFSLVPNEEHRFYRLIRR